ncbi:hypothetical protein LSAT2_017005 [Lamellibrachia satsuma]|nr:hypothetical protein LSAT2_017005 [Lamellibrachia satsuma]
MRATSGRSAGQSLNPSSASPDRDNDSFTTRRPASGENRREALSTECPRDVLPRVANIRTAGLPRWAGSRVPTRLVNRRFCSDRYTPRLTEKELARRRSGSCCPFGVHGLVGVGVALRGRTGQGCFRGMN